MIRESSTPSPRLRPAAVAGSLFLLLLATGASATTTWNGLRGPNSDGAVAGQLLEGDAPALEVGWKRDLGSGYSSVVVGDGRVIATFADGDADVMAAFSTETGDELWRYRIADTYVGHDGSHDGPISTPALDGSTVVGFGPRGDLFALNAADGKELWKLDVIEKLAAVKPHYGFTSSPVISDGVVAVALGGGEDNAFAGFSLKDGSVAWKFGGDSINYHSPVLATIGGRNQVLASGSTTLHGIDPASGEILWSHQHDGDQSAMGGGTIVPIPAGDDRIFLMNKNDSSTMLKVTAGGDGYSIEEMWSNNSLKTSYVIPAVHEGHIYGISGRILTAVNAETGERVWRSREPGDGFPTVVGDHLVIITKPGSLHVAGASPDGYQEIASLELFNDHSWSNVAFADGHLFARSMGELARIDSVSGGTAATAAPGWLGATHFGQFLSGLEGEGDKQAAVDAFLAEQGSFPIIEDNGAVHFVFRSGEAEDVGIVGDMIGFRREDPMTHVAGTDLFYYSTRLESDAAVSYGFLPAYAEQPIADPLNERLGPGLFGEVSFFNMPAWHGPSFDPKAEVQAGRVETVEWESAAREGAKRSATVYLPAAYDAEADRRFPVIYVHGGQSALDGGVAAAIDQLAGNSVEPLIAVFLAPPEENPRADTRDREAYGKMFAEELVGLIDGKYRTIADRNARASVGTADAGITALGTAFTYGDVFAKAASHSGILMNAADVAPMVPDANEQIFQIYQSWGTYHLRSPHEAWDMAQGNRDLWQTLRDKGHRPTGGESAVGFGWASWQPQISAWLEALFPAGQ